MRKQKCLACTSPLIAARKTSVTTCMTRITEKHKGQKPKRLRTLAGVASVVAGVAFSSPLPGATAAKASQCCESSKGCEVQEPKPAGTLSLKDAACSQHAENAVKEAKKRCKQVWKSQVPSSGLFQRTIMTMMTALSAMSPEIPAMINNCNMTTSLDFLIDSGAGRNLISKKGLPSAFAEHFTDPPEKLRFATWGV